MKLSYQRLIPAALLVSAATVLGAPEAQAQIVPLESDSLTIAELLGGDELTIGDKLMSDFSYFGPFGVDDATVTLSEVTELFYTVDFEFAESIGALPEGVYVFEYRFSVIPGFERVIVETQTDSNRAAGDDGSTSQLKEVFSDSGFTDLVATVESIDGDFGGLDGIPGLTEIWVRDTVTIEGDDLILDFSNGFDQADPIPEPTALLGLFALGSLGLVSKRNKKSA
ncbi:MAG: PEP-CTERM sorting domain-containing protein [Cyanobacteria bacterium P01_H01_bin.15]